MRGYADREGLRVRGVSPVHGGIEEYRVFPDAVIDAPPEIKRIVITKVILGYLK